MSRQIQFRRGTTAEHSAFTGAVGEVTVDTTKDTAVVHDGSTVGGFPLLRESAYTAADVLTKIKTVDGSGSGLDADLLDGKNAADTGVNTIVQRNASGNALALGAATGTSFNSITGLASVAPAMDGTATVGTSPLVARQDHVHPSDISKISTADVIMAIGNINSPLLDMPLKNSLAMKAGVGSATFTRASTATYVDRYGVLKTAAIDEARFEKEGYLNEGNSTNLLTYSGSNNYTSWNKDAYITLTVDGGVVTPSNIAGAIKVTSSDVVTTSYRVIKQSENIASAAAGSTYTASVYIKLGSAGKFRVRFAHAGGFIGAGVVTLDGLFTMTSDTGVTTSLIEIGNGWYSFSSTLISSITLTNLYVQYLFANTNTANVDYFYVDCMQLEALPFATSYIPTVASAVTRSADILKVTRQHNMPLNGAPFSLVLDCNILGLKPTTLDIGRHNIFDIRGINYYRMFIDNSNRVQGFGTTDGGNLSTYIFSDVVPTRRYALVTVGTTMYLYVNGMQIQTKTVGDTPIYNETFNEIVVGAESGGTRQTYGHISNFRIYDKALSSQEITLA